MIISCIPAAPLSAGHACYSPPTVVSGANGRCWPSGKGGWRVAVTVPGNLRRTRSGRPHGDRRQKLPDAHEFLRRKWEVRISRRCHLRSGNKEQEVRGSHAGNYEREGCFSARCPMLSLSCWPVRNHVMLTRDAHAYDKTCRSPPHLHILWRCLTPPSKLGMGAGSGDTTCALCTIRL